MSPEPPRVSFPQPGQIQGRPNGNAGRVLVIVFGTLFLLMFLCAGGAFVTYRRFNADSNFGGKFTDLRESVGGEIPNQTREAIKRATASEAEEAKEITDWINDVPMEIDTQRLVMEMQRSGLSNISVNPLSRFKWAQNIEGALESPEMGDHVSVLNFEWLVDDKEARVVVASFSEYKHDSSVYVLYLNRKDDEWFLFDWRDVLLPMSEAQFWAVFAGLNEPYDRTLPKFTEAAYSTFANNSLSNAEKIKKTMSTFSSFKFPRTYFAMAQDSLCRFLVLYEAKDELAEVVKNLNAKDFAGIWIYKAQSAAWSHDTELAFEYLDELIKQVGWHPKAAQMAAELARTPEQKHLAADWLQRSILLAPSNASNYFELADRQQIESLFQQIAKNKGRTASTVRLFESLGYLNERRLQFLSDVTHPIAGLEDVQKYLAFKLAAAKNDLPEVVNIAPSVLKLACFSNSQELLDRVEGVWQGYLHAAIVSNSLLQAAERAPDRDEFLSRFLNRAAFEYLDLPPQETLTLLKSIPSVHVLHDDINRAITIARMEMKQGNASEAFDSLFSLYKQKESEINFEEPSEFAYPLLRALGPVALECERWPELIDVIDPEVLLLLLARSDEIEPKQLEQVLDWYEKGPKPAAHWPKYFRSRIAFQRGDWPKADRLIAEAIDQCKSDLRITEDRLLPLVSMLADNDEYEYFDFESELALDWKWERMRYATRCNALDRFVAEAQIADRLDAELISWINPQVYSKASIESQEKIVSMLKASPLPQAQDLAAKIRSRLLVERGQLVDVFENAIKKAQGWDRDSYELKTIVKSAGTYLLKMSDKSRLEQLQQVSRGTDTEAYVDCIAATLEHDIPALCKALSSIEDNGPNYSRFIDLDVLKCLQGVQNLRDATVVQPVNVGLMRYTCVESRIVLAAETTEAAAVFEEFLKSKSITYKPLSVAMFDQSTAAFEVATSEGEFVVTFEVTKEDDFEKNAQTDTFAKEAHTIVMCAHKDIGIQERNSREIRLRKAINQLLDGFPTALAFGDVGATSVFHGKGWQQRFAQALHTGVDLAHPEEFNQLLKPKNSSGFIERDGQSFLVLGEVRELLPLKFETQALPWLDEIGVTLAPSILIPCLPADIVVKINR